MTAFTSRLRPIAAALVVVCGSSHAGWWNTAVPVEAQAQAPAAAQGKSATRDQLLGSAVNGFLKEWLVGGRPASAAEKYVSHRLNDERFVPRQAYSPAEYTAKFSGPRIAEFREMSSDQVHARISAHLDLVSRAIRVGSGEFDTTLPALATGDVQKADTELWQFLQPHKPRALPQVPAIAYTVRQWEDISWIAPSSAAYRAAMEDRFKAQGLEGQAVLVRLRQPSLETPVPLLFMLWVDESKTGNDWKLWGVEPESVH